MRYSSYVVGYPQADGRRYVTETHVTDSGETLTFDYLADDAAIANADNVLAERAAKIQARVDATNLVAEQGVPISRRITPQAFMARLTPSENAVIELAATDNPAADQMTRLQAAGLRANLRRLMSATYVDLDRRDDASAWAGMKALESAGLLASGRADEIVADDPQPVELPRL